MPAAIPAIVTMLLPIVIRWLSPIARKALSDGMRSFYQASLNSSNGLDDIAAKVLCVLLAVETADIKPTNGGAVNIPGELVESVTGGIMEIVTGRPYDLSIDGGA